MAPIDKEKQYTEIYIPLKMVEDKENAYDALIDIDSNFSKFIQGLLKQIYLMAKVIFSYGKNYRHFEWIILIRDRKTGKIFCAEDFPAKKKWTKVSKDDV